MGKRNQHNNNAARVAQHRKTTGTYHPQADQNNFMFLARGNGSVNLTALFLLGLVASGALIDGVSAATTTPNRGARAKSNTSRTTAHNATQVQTSSTPIGSQPQVTANLNLPCTFNVDNLNGANGNKYSLYASKAKTGQSVAFVDINGNGKADIVVGSPGETSSQPTGQANTVYGTNTSRPEIISLSNYGDNTTGFSLQSKTSDGTGHRVSNARDINGDKIPDLLLESAITSKGTPGDTDYFQYRDVAVLYGNKNGFSSEIDPNTLPPEMGFRIQQTRDDGSLVEFARVEGIGDIDQDGYGEIAISQCETKKGEVADCILYGSPNMEPVVDLSSTEQRLTVISGLGYNGFVGHIPADVGDLNGDDIPEVALGNPQDEQTAGSVAIFWGKKEGLPAEISNPDKYFREGGGVKLVGGQPGDRTGAALAGGVKTPDGRVAIAVSAPDNDAGRVYVVPVDTITTPSVNITELAQTQGATFFGEKENDRTGITLAPAGNFIDDNNSALLIGTEKDKAFVVSTMVTTPENQISLPQHAVKIVGPSGSGFGSSVASGDNNGDSRTDLAQGAPYAPNGGAAYTQLGGQTLTGCQPLAPTPTPTPSPASNHDDGDNIGVGKWVGATIGAGMIMTAVGFFAANKISACRQSEEMGEGSQLLPTPINS